MDDRADYAFVITRELVQALIVLVEAQNDDHFEHHMVLSGEEPEMDKCTLPDCRAAVVIADWLQDMGQA